MTQTFLDQLARTVASDKHIALFWDNAGYHTAKALVVPENMTLVALPPRSPELNPMENLWGYLRSHHWSNRTFANLDAVESAAVTAWHQVCLNEDRIKTVCRCAYLPK